MGDVDREAAAKRHGLPDGFAERLNGSTAEEVEADAAAVAALMSGRESEEPDHVKLARRAIEAAKDNPNAHVLAALAMNKHERDRALVESLYPSDPEQAE